MIKSKLYEHQKKNLQFHLGHQSSADWSEPGIGKSLIALSKVDILKNLNLVHKILIICPKTVMVTWAVEIEKHTNLSYTTLTGSVESKINRLKDDKSDIFIITYDSIPGRKTTRGLLFRAIGMSSFDFLICDEVPMIKNREAMRTVPIILFSDLIPQKLFLSGTPVTNDMTSILTIYRALDGGKTFGKNFFSARNRYFKNIGVYFPNWIIKETMKDEFTKKLYSIAVRVTKEECLDLPPKVWSSRYTDLSKEQREYYYPIADDIWKHLYTEQGEINIKSTLDKIGKLSQITSGFLYTKEGGTFFFGSNPKLELLGLVINEFSNDEKIIVCCRWRAEIKLIEEWCCANNILYASLSGETENRRSIISKFQDGDARIFICNISVGKYSLTLTAASTIIYYSMGFGIEEFVQFSDRIHRISQTKTCLYIPLLIHNGIDEYIYNSINKKLDTIQAIVDPELERVLKRRKI